MAYGALILFFGLVFDRVIGDPRSRFHPVALLGNLIALWGRVHFYPKKIERFVGVVGWFFTVAVCLFLPVLLYVFTAGSGYEVIFVVFSVFAFAFCIGWRSLEQHVKAVGAALKCGDEAMARKNVQFMVSRDASKLSFEQILSGAYESAAENLVDSIIAPVFWFVVFELVFGVGILGAVLFRAANTMDAMLGYKDERVRLGWFSARADDVLAFLPARVTGIILLFIFLCTGKIRGAVSVLRADRKKRPGFNGGIPMSLIAGGCGVMFEKPGVYTIGKRVRSLEEGGGAIIWVMRVAVCIAGGVGVVVMVLWGGGFW